MEVRSLKVWLHRRQALLSFKSLICQFLFVVSSWVYLSFFSTFFFYRHYSSFVSSFFFPLVTLGNNIEIHPDSSLEEHRHLAQDKISWQREKTAYPSPGWHIEIAVGPRWRGHLWGWNISLWDPQEHCFLTSSPVGQGSEQKQPSPHAK